MAECPHFFPRAFLSLLARHAIVHVGKLEEITDAFKMYFSALVEEDSEPAFNTAAGLFILLICAFMPGKFAQSFTKHDRSSIHSAHQPFRSICGARPAAQGRYPTVYTILNVFSMVTYPSLDSTPRA